MRCVRGVSLLSRRSGQSDAATPKVDVILNKFDFPAGVNVQELCNAGGKWWKKKVINDPGFLLRPSRTVPASVRILGSWVPDGSGTFACLSFWAEARRLRGHQDVAQAPRNNCKQKTPLEEVRNCLASNIIVTSKFDVGKPHAISPVIKTTANFPGP